MTSWAEELRGRSLGDARRLVRLRRLVVALTAHAEARLGEALGSWAALKAAYRFFSNRAITAEAILATALPACQERCGRAETVLILQDTTAVEYTAHPLTAGLGHIGRGKQQGLLVHTALAASPTAVPCGVLAQERWVRPRTPAHTAHTRRTRPLAAKESARWLRVEAASLAALPPGVAAVTVADREADLFPLFAAPRPAHAALLIRATHPRRVAEAEGTLWAAVAAAPVCGAHVVTLRRADERPPRTAHCTVRTRPITLLPPRNQRAGERWSAPVALTAILVQEEPAPRGSVPLSWLLLTTLAVPDLARAQQLIRWYSVRWLIERYHFVLKSGCRVEALQLQTAAKLEKALAVCCLVAWRVLWLTYLARAQPAAPCTLALSDGEWQALCCRVQQTLVPPTQPPTLHQAVRLIAGLGGFLGRTHDGDPGILTLWRGLTRLQDIAHDYHLFARRL
jgi:hypothetical protein